MRKTMGFLADMINTNFCLIILATSLVEDIIKSEVLFVIELVV